MQSTFGLGSSWYAVDFGVQTSSQGLGSFWYAVDFGVQISSQGFREANNMDMYSFGGFSESPTRTKWKQPITHIREADNLRKGRIANA